MNQFNYKLGDQYKVLIENGRLVFKKIDDSEKSNEGERNDGRKEQTNESIGLQTHQEHKRS